MTTLTIYRGRGQRWMVHSDSKSIPECLRDMPAGGFLNNGANSPEIESIKAAVEWCNPGCCVVVEGQQ